MSEWVALSAVIARDQLAELTRLFEECGATGFEEAPPDGLAPDLVQPWENRRAIVHPRLTLRTWLSPQEASRATEAVAQKFPDLELLLETVKEEDWANAWKTHHHRIPISGSLTVSPPWEAQEGDLIIPPGNAFGTGDHPSTFECLRFISELAPSATSCLDVGCGSGVLALAATKLGVPSVGIDIDAPSVQSAIENAELNGLHADFSTTPLERITTQHDLVVANLFAEVLVALAPELLRVTSKHLVLAGILNEKADSVLEALAELDLRERITSEAWTCLHLERP